MDELAAIYREIHELKACIAEKHVQAWRHRVAGDRASMKSVHANIKACKRRIADCNWMIGDIYRRMAPNVNSATQVRSIVTSWCYFAFEVWVLATLLVIGIWCAVRLLVMQFSIIWCYFKCNHTFQLVPAIARK